MCSVIEYQEHNEGPGKTYDVRCKIRRHDYGSRVVVVAKVVVLLCGKLRGSECKYSIVDSECVEVLRRQGRTSTRF